MINDLRVQNVPTWKYVDDTTIAEVVPRGARSEAQSAVSTVVHWSEQNLMQLNSNKCKELIIDFKKKQHVFDPTVVNGNDLQVVGSAKILGLTISNDLRWNLHVSESIKKANKRLYFLIMLKRASIPLEDIKNFYCTTIRPVLEYGSPVYHHALPQYLSDQIERVQKIALAIINPGVSYDTNLVKFDLTTLSTRRSSLCSKLFDSISKPAHRLHSLLPPRNESKYSLRRSHQFNLPNINTERYKRTFIPSMCRGVDV